MTELSNNNAKLAFFLNVHNLLTQHGMLENILSTFTNFQSGFVAYLFSEGPVARYKFSTKTIYTIGGEKLFDRIDSTLTGYEFNLFEIEHGIIRGNRSPSGFIAKGTTTSKICVLNLIVFGTLVPKMAPTDPKAKFQIMDIDPRINFALNYGHSTCPELIV